MIDLNKLYTRLLNKIDICEEIEFTKEDIKNTEIVNEFKCNIKGYINIIEDDIYMNAIIKANLYLPCSVTLKPVLYKINIKYDDYIDKNLINSQKALDLKEFLWQNIVVEIPSKVVSENAYDKELKGDGWALIDKETPKNNPFADIAELINKKG